MNRRTFTQLVEQASQLPRLLYHGTSASEYEGIQRDGMRAKSFWSPDQAMAQYFAYHAGDDNVVIQLPFDDFNPAAFMPDQAMWQEPVDPLADYWDIEHIPSMEWDDIIYDKWMATDQTWQASMMVLRSVIYTLPLPAHLFGSTLGETNELTNAMTTVYHITPDANLPNIRDEGLQPMLGPNSQQIGETVPAIHVFTNKEAMEEALMNWDAMDWSNEDIELSLITLNVPVMMVQPATNYQNKSGIKGIAEIHQPIPPSMIISISEIY